MRLYVSMHADKEMEQKAFKEVPAITFARFTVQPISLLFKQNVPIFRALSAMG